MSKPVGSLWYKVSKMASKNKYRRKREFQGSDKAENSSLGSEKDEMNSPVIAFFKEIQKELDTRYDKHERIVKSSRDLTIHSKRAIFLLQRVTGADKQDDILGEAEQKLVELNRFLKAIAVELVGEDPYRFRRAYSPGLQEYIEALSFYHYLKYSHLISPKEVQTKLEFNESEDHLSLKLNPMDYILGIADLTGELMRLCMNSAASGDTETPFTVCKFLREVHDSFVAFGNINRDIGSKLKTLNSSLNKVERACYTLEVRGSEIPKHMLTDLISSKPDYNDDNN